MSVLKDLYHHKSGQVTIYDRLSPPFVAFDAVRRGCSISPFLINFIIEDAVQKALSGLLDDGVELLPGNRDLTWSMPMLSPC